MIEFKSKEFNGKLLINPDLVTAVLDLTPIGITRIYTAGEDFDVMETIDEVLYKLNETGCCSTK